MLKGLAVKARDFIQVISNPRTACSAVSIFSFLNTASKVYYPIFETLKYKNLFNIRMK